MRSSRLLLASLALLASSAAQAEALGIVRVTPEGDDVKDTRQIVIAFDRAVVPLGRMEREASEVPVTLDPAIRCDWRWLDPSTLACNLPSDEKLRLASRYTVEIRPEFVTEQGEKLERGQTTRFVTERAQLRYTRVADWEGPGQPVVYARFTQPVTAASVAAALRIGGTAVQAQADPDDREMPFWTPRGEAREQWLLRPVRALPLDTAQRLWLSPGLESIYGTETGIEDREAENLHTFPELRLLGISCLRNAAPGSEPQWGIVHEGQSCDPLGGAALSFSAPVRTAEVKDRLTLEPDPRKAFKKDYDPWANGGDEGGSIGGHSRESSYSVSLPFNFIGGSSYRGALAAGLRDVFGRELKARDFAFRTGDRTPRMVFEHERAVIESGIDSEVPAIVTNLGSIDARFSRLTAAGLQKDQQHRVPVQPVRNIAFAMPLDVRGMIGASSGAVSGSIVTTPSTSSEPQRFFAEVTPWQVHAKLGNSNLLVWVTDMASGKPVSKAKVSVLLGFGGDSKAEAVTDSNGLAELPGTAVLDPELKNAGWRPDPGLMVRVAKDQDLALLPLEYEFQVDVYRASRNQFSEWRRPKHGHLRSWGTTAQGVYRAGETVQYKIYVRDEAGRSLAAAPKSGYTLKVYDPTGNAVLEQAKLSLSDFGALSGDLKLGERAAVGWYRFELTPDFAKDDPLEPLRVLVSDFTPAPFRVGAELRAHEAKPGDEVEAVLAARLHGGGPFSGAPARMVVRVDAAPFTSKDPVAMQYEFASYEARAAEPLLDTETQLDAQGQFAQKLKLPQIDTPYGRLLFDATVQDDRGKGIGAQATVPYYGRDRYAGVRWDGWMLQQGKEASVGTIVVGSDGKPVKGQPYYVKVDRQETKGARVKGAGNAYITRYVQSWKRVGTCKGRSKAEGVACAFTPDASGEFRITVMTQDTQGRLHESSTWVYAQGSDEVLWEDTPDYSLELRADRYEYKDGDTAKLMVKNPYPGARALVTVERYGVLDRWVEKLSGSTPEIRIPVKPEYFPGAYVSVVVMSPRVDQPLKEGVDLGKPSFRMGYLELRVNDPTREMKVKVLPQREEMRPRETVKIELEAAPRHKKPGDRIEYAVAVLDEAVFDLIKDGKDYFDPLKGFTRLDALDVANFGLLTRLVGRQKFEKKGANPGGDGGSDLSMRSIDKYVAYWNPALPADSSGRARFEFQAPDNLTGWRILALAVTPDDRMGLGQAVVKVNKNTELRPALPNHVIAGDRFDAGFTLLNRGKGERSFTLSIRAEGATQGAKSETFTLKPFERRNVYLPLQAPTAGEIRLTVQAGEGKDADALVQTLKVLARKPNITVADYGHFEAGAEVRIPLKLPETMERGELKFTFAPTVLGDLDGAFGYVRQYPYACWEQRLTKAVMAAHYLKLRPRLKTVGDWPEAQQLATATLEQAASFQAEEGGMGYWSPDAQRQSPYLSAYTALAFGWMKDLGYEPPKLVWDRLDTYLEKLLKEDISAEGFDAPETRAQVRAVALAALAQRGKLKKDDLERYASWLPRMGLFGQSLFLQAASRVDGSGLLMKQTRDLILSRGQESAGSLMLREDDDSSWRWWLLGSELRSNCAALSAFTGRYGWDAAMTELPMKLTRTITQARGNRFHWSNTQENLFCTRAFIEYADRFESVTPDLLAQVMLGEAKFGEVKVTREQGGQLQKPVTAQQAGAAPPILIQSQGQGRAYFTAALSYVEKEAAARAINAGMQARRSYAVLRDKTWVPMEPPLKLKRGDKVRVELTLDLPSWATYIVVDDPVPGGLEPVNPDLANVPGDDAALAMDGAYAFYHRELRHDAVRFFADSAGPGEYRMAWLGVAVATGDFAVPETHAELMYSPEVFGNGMPARLTVTE
ncbi:large extracellular alpha-helical protein [Solimonas sp. K1W22B-7]|uniref:alpha-2-macroglobulin family protein n=1 Tax=Solimonas sp. K1W22B-7 TaxID=2303331 RepID=UPI000E330B3E|nr:alpha-2-macroglobulin family protein [Solimonas sp. K1W22B-7]AXQ29104.1 large extracellular alpha-helical protein [Solimonas sp. K1W22B-7]